MPELDDWARECEQAAARTRIAFALPDPEDPDVPKPKCDDESGPWTPEWVRECEAATSRAAKALGLPDPNGPDVPKPKCDDDEGRDEQGVIQVDSSQEDGETGRAEGSEGADTDIDVTDCDTDEFTTPDKSEIRACKRVRRARDLELSSSSSSSQPFQSPEQPTTNNDRARGQSVSELESESFGIGITPIVGATMAVGEISARDLGVIQELQRQVLPSPPLPPTPPPYLPPLSPPFPDFPSLSSEGPPRAPMGPMGPIREEGPSAAFPRWATPSTRSSMCSMRLTLLSRRAACEMRS